MSLKSETIDAIFARMLARYGSTWIAKWQGVPLDAVKADWAEQLDSIGRDSILYALRYLPLEFPPTSAQFKAICSKAPLPAEMPALAPPRDPVKAAELAATVKQAAETFTNPDKLDPKAWAHRLKARDESGEKLTITQRAMYRAALEPRTA